jgi:hypothetical protein
MTTNPVLRSPKTWFATGWLIGFGATLAWSWRLSMLFDSDSYYHLAVAREYARHGVLSDLPWARFSVMRHGFGDKDLLFHLLLAPFTAAFDPLFGGKVLIAGLTALILGTLALSASEALGPSGMWLPVLLLFGSLSFDLRIIRLRPELLALLLLLWTLRALQLRRYAWLVPLSAAFALAYSAVHALLGVCALCFACALWLERKPQPRMLLFPLLGAALGLGLHPHFPHNLRVLYLQNVTFWRFTGSADVGDEILPLGFGRFLAFDWPLLLGVAVLAASLEHSSERPSTRARESAWFLSAAALAFSALFVHSARFALYALPFGLLAAAWLLRSHGWQFAERMRGLGRHAPRTWLVLALLCCVAAPRTAAALSDVVDRGGCVWPALRSQLERLGRTLPANAKVAATWSAAEDYMYFAPQARYLNVLDPIFMRAANPTAYDVQRRLFAAELVDVPLALRRDLDSDYIAFSAPSLPALQAQLSSDPRVTALIAGGHALYRVEAERNRAFVLQLRAADSRALLLHGGGRAYPRLAEPAARAVEGFIETARVDGAQRCLWFSPDALAPGDYEFDSGGDASVWQGEQRLLSVSGHARLVLGRGPHVHVSQNSGPLHIQVCSGPRAALFYLLRRDPGGS